MITKNHVNKIVILGLAGIALLTQPTDVKAAPANGASFMVSSIPVVLKAQVSKNVFTVDIPNSNGGYTTVILLKLGNRFVGLPGLPFIYGE